MPVAQRESVVDSNLSTMVRRQLMERIEDARRRSDALFEIVRPDAIYERPIPERHRIIFYVGHLEAFDWNLLHENVLGLKSFHPEFDRLFAFGIDPVGGGLPLPISSSDWPSLNVLYATTWSRIFARCSGTRNWQTEAWKHSVEHEMVFRSYTLLNVAIEHRLMHVETLAYMLHQLPVHQKTRQIIQSSFLLLPLPIKWFRFLRVWQHWALCAGARRSAGITSSKPTPHTCRHLRLINMRLRMGNSSISWPAGDTRRALSGVTMTGSGSPSVR